ncbi:hypothetical protein CKO38_10485 [Rhodospirillum rubrum]|uniref:hypothetical protein n=1 Tax=Rhodospirillum rubrum TaxID=1085 RepID=UPI00190303BC|nr:hypothetical protein [Rhodospirillum rubrum]MBK1662899.1 hypothetical protein [Rhodospirillum rubrum]MBK1677085.1 hypothetical protein [Rhodospirillum rubrum]
MTESPERGRKRLGIYLAHFLDHVEGHMGEIGAQRDALAEDARLGALVDQALADMVVARASLSAVLRDLDGEAPAPASPDPAHSPFHSHRHSHDHDHAHSHDHDHCHCHDHP